MGSLSELLKKPFTLVILILVVISIGALAFLLSTNSDETATETKETKDFGDSKDKKNKEKEGDAEVWSGTVTITGDTGIDGDLIIEAGTVVKFVVGDDQKGGNGIEADGYNDKDPTRLANYEQSHASLSFMGKVTAIGTKENPITFTSAAKKPNHADWEGITFHGDGSTFEHIILEYSRHGLSPMGEHANSIVKNSTFRNNFWAGISGNDSSIQIISNQFSGSGHEAIDIQDGSSKAVIKNNVIKNCHTGIVVLGGSPEIKNNTMTNVGNGIHVTENATPVLSGNKITLAPDDSKLEWRYGDFAYQMFGDPKTY